MRFQYQCVVPECKATGWARGWSEPDVNAAGICDNDPMEDACQHIQDGGEYNLIDSEYDDE